MNKSLSHKSALVIIPPEDDWPLIQCIRQQYDSKLNRWMPHITLVYPFVPIERFESVGDRVRHACDPIAPFKISLAHFDSFRHRRGKYTVWLDPQPNDAVEQLHATIVNSLIEFDDKFENSNRRFRPHLSVGQCRGRDQVARLSRVGVRRSKIVLGDAKLPG